jgi:hypothetical protein
MTAYGAQVYSPPNRRRRRLSAMTIAKFIGIVCAEIIRQVLT